MKPVTKRNAASRPAAVVLLLLLVAATLTLVSVAGARPVAAKQRVVIQWKGPSGFLLTPMTGGALKSDAGAASFCCWHSGTVVRNGLKTGTGDPRMTLVGQHGTLTATNQMEFLGLRGGYEIFTGTWKAVRGTGDYAGLSGGGRVAGITFPNGVTKWQREGFLGTK